MANINTAEAWVIQPRERARYEEQFSSLRPVNGIITGDQAKGFLLQSQLPPPVLGQIWSLADTDSDGKMNINEFSIACKLINLKLRNFELPKVLPQALLQSASQSLVKPQSPPQIPLVGLVTTQPITTQPPARPSVPPMIPPLPNPALIQHHNKPAVPPLVPVQPLVQNVQPYVPNTQPMVPKSIPIIPNIPMAPVVPVMAAPVVVPMTSQPVQPMMSQPVQPMMSQPVQPMVSQPVQPIVSKPVQPMAPVSAAPPQPIRPPSAPPMERGASIESPLGGEWAVPQATRLKYTQLFNTMDRARSGFISGPQARNVMVQAQLPQPVLAQIWTLADMDSDGRLSCEEFVLALHLCEAAKRGEKISPSLPPALVPPTFRRHSQSAAECPADSLINTTFEDKRKENFDKGQAELERRRKTLLDIQRKEQEERARKEREEEEKRERIRLEQEARRQAELERQLERQRQAEEAEVEQRKRLLEQKENARKEAERLRQSEWEKQRQQELEMARQKEQEKVLKMKAKNQALGIELSQLNNEAKKLSGGIAETRLGVAAVKQVIDTMRSTRDGQLAEMSALKTKLKEQNQRLINLTQEKSRMEAKNRMNAAQDSVNQEQAEATFNNCQIALKQRRDKLQHLQEEIESKLSDIDNNNSQLSELRLQLSSLIQECEGLYATYDDRRNKVLHLKSRRDPTDYSQSWGAPEEEEWPAQPEEAWPAEPVEPEEPAAQPAEPEPEAGYSRYRALYEFVARNGDEISFQPGDIIMVPQVHDAEPGWLAGKIRGHTGWFPESYVEPASPQGTSSVDQDAVAASSLVVEKSRLEEIEEVVEVQDANAVGHKLVEEIVHEAENTVKVKQGGLYVALYSYASPEQGDLSFNAGDIIRVVACEGDWWTGVLGDAQGIFPSNYVTPADDKVAVEPAKPAAIEPVPEPQPVKKESPPAEKPAAVEPFMTTAAVQPVKQEPQPTVKSPATPDFAAMASAAMGKSRKPEVATVLANYAATSTEQLSLVRGQLVMIRKKTATGWWEGELQAKGRKRQVGWFPASYVKPMSSGRNTPVSLEQTNKMDTPDLDTRERVIALFQYTALNDDELSFEKDEVIVLIAKEEDAWWRGELRGKSGLFPSNYVAAI